MFFHLHIHVAVRYSWRNIHSSQHACIHSYSTYHQMFPSANFLSPPGYKLSIKSRPLFTRSICLPHRTLRRGWFLNRLIASQRGLRGQPTDRGLCLCFLSTHFGTRKAANLIRRSCLALNGILEILRIFFLLVFGGKALLWKRGVIKSFSIYISTCLERADNSWIFASTKREQACSRNHRLETVWTSWSIIMAWLRSACRGALHFEVKGWFLQDGSWGWGARLKHKCRSWHQKWGLKPFLMVMLII